MGVMMQAFYDGCPEIEKQECKWWNHLKGIVPALSQDGFTALWLPPPGKCNYYKSMGYDVFDYFDLGEFEQKGNIATWFGTKDELTGLIKEIHNNNMHAYCDMVLNHNSGGDSEINPLTGEAGWTKFSPASNKFNRDWQCFHPNYYHPMNDNRDEGVFGGMPDLCHLNPYVSYHLLTYAKWLIEKIGYDGFRYDYVKGFGGWVVKAIQDSKYKKFNNDHYIPFGVGEFWDYNDLTITSWLDSVNSYSSNPVSAFDFPLRNRLKNLCENNDFNIEELKQGGVIISERPFNAVTFADNHDTHQNETGGEIVNDKMLAYAYILTHEGYPCVFWKDYYNYGLARPGFPDGITALISIHEKYASGKTIVHQAENNLYIMQRTGTANQKGLFFALNNSYERWNSNQVNTGQANQKFVPLAWGGKDNKKPEDIISDKNGNVDFGASPRGYAVYI